MAFCRKKNLGDSAMVDQLMRQRLKNLLDLKLFTHSLGVEKTAVMLARRWDADPEKAATAALFHDYGKIFTESELRSYASELGLELDEVTSFEPALLHAPVGAELVRKNFNITDLEVLEAIAFHTTGKPGMGKLAKIIYLADIIEPGRYFFGVSKLREAARKGLDRGVLAAVEHTISYVLGSGSLLHLDSVRLRNSLLKKSFNDYNKGHKDKE
ncbi:MAG: bis(5'-nucleosyl)-tetraphosphatase (symmetrical) YqeK [Dethiobacteria bacterium]|nr:HD domain-containing protein [Bacillota bacterium]